MVSVQQTSWVDQEKKYYFQVFNRLPDSLYRPGAGGAGDRWAALERLRDLARPAPVVICTAYSAAEFAGYAARGFGALVLKPFRLDALTEVIRDQLAAGGRGAPRRAGG